jgi:hypothetical protein
MKRRSGVVSLKILHCSAFVLNRVDLPSLKEYPSLVPLRERKL